MNNRYNRKDPSPEISPDEAWTAMEKLLDKKLPSDKGKRGDRKRNPWRYAIYFLVLVAGVFLFWWLSSPRVEFVDASHKLQKDSLHISNTLRPQIKSDTLVRDGAGQEVDLSSQMSAGPSHNKEAYTINPKDSNRNVPAQIEKFDEKYKTVQFSPEDTAKVQPGSPVKRSLQLHQEKTKTANGVAKVPKKKITGNKSILSQSVSVSSGSVNSGIDNPATKSNSQFSNARLIAPRPSARSPRLSIDPSGILLADISIKGQPSVGFTGFNIKRADSNAISRSKTKQFPHKKLPLQYGLQWNVPLPFHSAGHYFMGLNARNQYHTFLVPALWAGLRINKQHELQVHFSPMQQAQFGRKTLQVDSLRRSPLDSPSVERKTDMIKTGGMAVGIQCNLRIANNWSVGVGFSYQWQSRVLLNQTRTNFITNNVLEDSLYGLKAANGNNLHLKPGFIIGKLELAYRTNKWQTGISLLAPITTIYDRVRLQSNGNLFFRWSFRKTN